MRWRKLRRNIYTGLSYGFTLLLVMSVPMTMVYADESQVASPIPEAPNAVTNQAPAPQPSPSPESTNQENTKKVARRGSLAEWRAKKSSASSQLSQQTSETPAPPTGGVSSGTPAVTPLATVRSDGTIAESNGSRTGTSTNTATDTGLSNALTSIVKSGNADVIKNMTAGNATSGDTAASASVINNVNSIVANQNNKEAATFVSNIMGDTTGDIILQPMLLKAMLEAGAAQQPTTQSSSNTTGMENNISLTSVSGDATVAANTSAGSATTGSAHAVADVLNIVNSMVSANQSFVGTINIYGNLNGDILIAPDFIPQMIANNQQMQSVSPNDANLAVESNDTQAIINNVTLAAESGQALVNGNTSAGSSTTGNADTNLVIFNLTGHEIVARDSLLVFVNVLGKWVGVIVDAPTGATAAAIGANVTKNEATAPNMIIDIDNDTQIINNIDLSSRSGDATVARNTNAGNATTGNATASANILNMSNSQVNLTGWFGVLFINVFGAWTGSFGVDTDAGTRVVVPSQSGEKPAVIRFVPRQANTVRPAAVAIVTPQQHNFTGRSAVYESRPAALQAYNETVEQTAHVEGPTAAVLGQIASKARPVNIGMLVGSLVIIAVSAFGIRRLVV